MPISFRPTIKPLPAFFGICVLIFLPIFLASVLITLLLPETYAGQAQIMINGPSGSATSASNPDWVTTEMRALFSNVVLESVAKRLDLPNVWGKKYNNGTPMNEADVLAMLNTRVEVFTSNHSGKLARTTPIVEVRAYSDNPKEAALLANGVVESYRDLRAAESQPSERRVMIMSTAVPDDRPVRPNKQLNCLIGALAGMLVGVVIAPLILGVVAAIRKSRSTPPIPLKA